MIRRVLILICVHGVLAWDMVLEGPKTVGIGQKLSLSCNATQLESVPTDVEWFKGYDRLFPDTRISMTSIKSQRAITGKLSVKNVTLNDGGKYKCWLSNEMIRHVVVTVAENPITGADSGAARRQFPTAPSLIATLVLFALCLEAV